MYYAYILKVGWVWSKIDLFSTLRAGFSFYKGNASKAPEHLKSPKWVCPELGQSSPRVVDRPIFAVNLDPPRLRYTNAGACK
eukprot:scaffold52837_cov16-Tisochrysis_lutea.AAC.1